MRSVTDGVTDVTVSCTTRIVLLDSVNHKEGGRKIMYKKIVILSLSIFEVAQYCQFLLSVQLLTVAGIIFLLSERHPLMRGGFVSKIALGGNGCRPHL